VHSNIKKQEKELAVKIDVQNIEEQSSYDI